VFCLEVKGGGVSCHEGTWTYTDRWGDEHRSSEGPLEQVKSGMYALRQLLERLGMAGELKGVTFGWGVAFPDCRFTDRGVELDPALILDSERCRTKESLAQGLQRLVSFWRSKDAVRRTLTAAGIKRIIECCRPNIDVVPLLGPRLEGVTRLVTSLTDEQYRFIDALEDAPRLLCQGGAGTGKTFLAAEAANRERAAGRSVMLVCRSPVLAEFLRRRVNSSVIVRTARDLDGLTGTSPRVQSLVVDEAQDFLTFAYLQKLEQLVEGGLEGGRWRVFLDPNNQAGIYGEFDPDALDYLRNCSAVPLKLRRNCRNTEPIVRQTQLATGADIGSTLIDGGGPAVELVSVSDRAAEAAALADRIDSWQAEGVEPGRITILSPLELKLSAAGLLPEPMRRRMTLITPVAMAKWPGNTLSFASIEHFKGLENQCIAVVDLAAYDGSPRAQSELYVAMTRAHAGLWIAMPANARGLLDKVRAENLLRLTSTGDR
jgi:hypothetical protein